MAETYSTVSIARFIQSNFKTDREKFRAIYTWVTTNIEYDTDSMYAINWNRGREAKITEALRRRKGVCENYAAIFNDISVKSGLFSFVVDGYTKQAGTLDKSGHSWCAVHLDGEWLLCDPTWDKDARTDPNYFLASPSWFIESHMPFDPMWQLLDHPISHPEFYRGITGSKKDRAFFNVADSIKAFSLLGELQRLEATALRMSRAGQINEMVRNRIAYTKMQIGIIYEEKDMNLYNAAVADFNRASTVFNYFVQYRNNQFLPAKTEAEIYALLDPVAATISSAWQKISGIGKEVPNYQYDPGELRNRLDGLRQRVQEQKEFLKRYYASSDAEKKMMFYK